MKIEEAAEKYVRGFYFRPDGDTRGWETYGANEVSDALQTFAHLYDHGGEVLKIDHVYSDDMELTVVLEIRLPSEGALDCLEAVDHDRPLYVPDKTSPNRWVYDLYIDLIGEQGNLLHHFPKMEGGPFDVKLVVSESY